MRPLTRRSVAACDFTGPANSRRVWAFPSVDVPSFAHESWYRDPQDPRCPQGALLEDVQVEGPARAWAALTLTVLSARGQRLMFRYEQLADHDLKSYTCDQGMGEWRRDEFTRTDRGTILHRITWQSAENGAVQWRIEARRVTLS